MRTSKTLLLGIFFQFNFFIFTPGTMTGLGGRLGAPVGGRGGGPPFAPPGPFMGGGGGPPFMGGGGGGGLPEGGGGGACGAAAEGIERDNHIGDDGTKRKKEVLYLSGRRLGGLCLAGRLCGGRLCRGRGRCTCCLKGNQSVRFLDVPMHVAVAVTVCVCVCDCDSE